MDNETLAPKSSIGMESNIAGLLCYVPFIGALVGLIFFLLEKESRFVRFHGLQALLLGIALFVINLVLGFIPILGWIISILLWFAEVALWIFLMIKAYQGEMFKLPVIGDIAEKQANQLPSTT